MNRVLFVLFFAISVILDITSKNFVLDSGVPYDDYANAMNRFSTKGGEILINTIGQMPMPQELMALMQLYIVDRIMEEYNIGKYNDEIPF